MIDNKVQQKKFLLYEEKQSKINLNLELKLNKKSSYSTLNIKFRTLNIKPNFKRYSHYLKVVRKELHLVSNYVQGYISHIKPSTKATL